MKKTLMEIICRQIICICFRSANDDQEQFRNPVKTTEAIENFDKVIIWVKDNIDDYTAMQVIRTLR